MSRLAILLILVAAPAFSATVGSLPVEWHGPGGPRGCQGDCGLDWALDTLPSYTPRDLIEQAIAANPQGSDITVVSGDELVMMSYAIDGTPYADLRGGVAVLDEPEPATGWTVQANGETWIFAIVHGCQNWTLIKQPSFGSASALEKPPSVSSGSSSQPPLPGPLSLPVAGPQRPILLSHGAIPTSPVPIPGSGWLAALALVLITAIGLNRRETT